MSTPAGGLEYLSSPRERCVCVYVCAGECVHPHPPLNAAVTPVPLSDCVCVNLVDIVAVHVLCLTA